jgi:hypothetical protein
MYQTLYSFDFDETLIHTMLPDPGMEIWKEKTGTPWPYRGWWSKSETLDMRIFDTPKNEWVYKKYLESKADPSSYTILATGRLDTISGMREGVNRILEHYDLTFDEIHLNWGGDTFKFKKTLFERLILKTGCRNFVMFDDRSEHLTKFEEWAITQPCSVTIVDVVNKTTKTFNV